MNGFWRIFKQNEHVSGVGFDPSGMNWLKSKAWQKSLLEILTIWMKIVNSFSNSTDNS